MPIGFWIWAGIVVVLAGLLWWGMKPKRHRHVPVAEFDYYVSGFLAQLDEGGVMMLDREAGPGFLQLAMRENGVSQTVEFGLPEAEWIDGSLDDLAALLEADGYPVNIETAPNAHFPRFLRALVRGLSPSQSSRATDLLTAIAERLGWSDGLFTIHYEGDLGPQSKNLQPRDV